MERIRKQTIDLPGGVLPVFSDEHRRTRCGLLSSSSFVTAKCSLFTSFWSIFSVRCSLGSGDGDGSGDDLISCGNVRVIAFMCSNLLVEFISERSSIDSDSTVVSTGSLVVMTASFGIGSSSSSVLFEAELNAVNVDSEVVVLCDCGNDSEQLSLSITGYVKPLWYSVDSLHLPLSTQS